MAAIHDHIACCAAPHRNQSSHDRLLFTLEKASAVALGIFSALASMELFLAFFLVGTAVGLYQSYYSNASERTASQSAVACSQGLLEQLTGAKLPPLVSLVANLAITWCHIDHHTSVFVPVVGVSLGAWAGQTMGRLSSSRVHLTA